MWEKIPGSPQFTYCKLEKLGGAWDEARSAYVFDPKSELLWKPHRSHVPAVSAELKTSKPTWVSNRTGLAWYQERWIDFHDLPWYQELNRLTFCVLESNINDNMSSNQPILFLFPFPSIIGWQADVSSQIPKYTWSTSSTHSHTLGLLFYRVCSHSCCHGYSCLTHLLVQEGDTNYSCSTNTSGSLAVQEGDTNYSFSTIASGSNRRYVKVIAVLVRCQYYNFHYTSEERKPVQGRIRNNRIVE